MFYPLISQSSIQKHTLKLNSWINLDASSPLYFPLSFNSPSLINYYISRAQCLILLLQLHREIRNDLPITYQKTHKHQFQMF